MSKLKNSFWLIFIILISIVIGIVLVVSCIFYFSFQNSGKIANGVFIKGINISDMTKDEAKKTISNYLNDNMANTLVFEYKNYGYNVEIEQIEANFDIDGAVNYAYNIGRNGNFLQNIKDYISVVMNRINIEPILKYDEKALDDYIDFLEISLPDQVEQAAYYVEDDELVITTGLNGAGIIKDKLKEMIIDSLQDISYSNRIFVIPTYTVYPNELDIDNVHNSVYREMKNASYTTNPYTFQVEERGIDFDVNAVKNTVIKLGTNEEHRFNLMYTEPEITIQNFGMDAFPDLLGTFSTRYVNNPNRTVNLRLASNKMSEKVLMPGESFSFNSIVGPRTVQKGYREAAIYSDGTVTNGVGGGICQVVTTLYNAVIKANLKITNRRNHSFCPTYVGPGEDATVVYGSQDFEFVNSRDYPVKIISSVENGYCTVSIYGLKTDNEFDVSIETNIIKTMPRKTAGGANGYVVDSFRVTKQNGQVISREKISRDTYSAH